MCIPLAISARETAPSKWPNYRGTEVYGLCRTCKKIHMVVFVADCNCCLQIQLWWIFFVYWQAVKYGIWDRRFEHLPDTVKWPAFAEIRAAMLGAVRHVSFWTFQDSPNLRATNPFHLSVKYKSVLVCSICVALQNLMASMLLTYKVNDNAEDICTRIWQMFFFGYLRHILTLQGMAHAAFNDMGGNFDRRVFGWAIFDSSSQSG